MAKLTWQEVQVKMVYGGSLVKINKHFQEKYAFKGQNMTRIFPISQKRRIYASRHINMPMLKTLQL